MQGIVEKDAAEGMSETGMGGGKEKNWLLKNPSHVKLAFHVQLS